MEEFEEKICLSCHVKVRPTDYFCYNCGKNLQPQSLSTSISSQIILYLKSIFLLPLGIVWGIRYLKQPDRKSKIVGLVAIVITVFIIVSLIRFTVNIINVLNSQLNG